MTIAKRFQSGWMLLLLASLSLLVSGCEMKLPPMPWDPPKPADKTTTETPPAEQATASEEETGPLDERSLLPPVMKTLPFIEVTIPVREQVELYGRLYDPSLKMDESAGDGSAVAPDSSYAGPKYPLVILAHGLNRSHLAWSDLPDKLVKAGYAVFALDLRGHGKSTHASGGRRVTWRLFEKGDWPKMASDLGQVLHYFQSGEDYPEVNGNQAVLIGEKLGANLSVLAGTTNQSAVKALVLICPGLDYKGIMPSQAILDYENPVLLLSSQDDDYSNKSTHGIYNWISGSKTLLEYGKVGDGADMLTNRPGIEDAIRDWLLRTLPTGVTPPTSSADSSEKDTPMQAVDEASKLPVEGSALEAKPVDASKAAEHLPDNKTAPASEPAHPAENPSHKG